MTLKDFYSKIGGDYDDVLTRLLSEIRIKSFVVRFLDDKNFERLCEALDIMNYDTAYNFAHNLKGLARNLGFTNLAESADKIGNVLHSDNKNNQQIMHTLIKEATTNYKEIELAIKELQNSL